MRGKAPCGSGFSPTPRQPCPGHDGRSQSSGSLVLLSSLDGHGMAKKGAIMPNLSVLGLGAAVLAELKGKANREGASVNAGVPHLIDDGLGRHPPKPESRRYDDLDALAGTWSIEEAEEFSAATEAFEQIDEFSGSWFARLPVERRPGFPMAAASDLVATGQVHHASQAERVAASPRRASDRSAPSRALRGNPDDLSSRP